MEECLYALLYSNKQNLKSVLVLQMNDILPVSNEYS